MHASPLRIAVVGSGIAGLSAAWLLSKRHDVTVYEAADVAGGHANTIDIVTDRGRTGVDTGFIVYNPPNYPNFRALLEHLGVATKRSRMTFSFSSGDGAYEYSGTRLDGLFGQPRNIVRLGHWRMLGDLLRFFREAAREDAGMGDDVMLADYLAARGYGPEFVDNHLMPMAAAIWSARACDMQSYPARSFIRFFANHGLLKATGRPQWRTVDGGSRSYVQRLMADGKFTLRVSTAVRAIRRTAGHVDVATSNDTVRFDHVVLACHADQAERLLQAPAPAERSLLGAFAYSRNAAVVHFDETFMPARRRLWSSWNYLRPQSAGDQPSVTYWMNSLQALSCRQDVFVTLNPGTAPRDRIASFDYDHPLFTVDALRAQRQLWSLQGERRTWFCGSYFGAGFHEDALQSGLAVAEALGGGRRPWTVNDENGRIFAASTAPFREAAE